MQNFPTLISKLDDDPNEYKQIEEENLDDWLMKIYKNNQKTLTNADFFERLKRDFHDHWSKNYRSIIEIHPFFNQLSFELKLDIVNFLFSDFLNKFQLFFFGLETGYVIEILINLYPKTYCYKNKI